MLHVTRPEGTLLYTGDFTLQSSLTAEAAAPRKADHLVMETTYGLPHFKFPPRSLVIDQLLSLVESAFRSNRQPIILAYSLGKAQELTKILTNAHYPVTLHGAPHNLCQIYDRHLPHPPSPQPPNPPSLPPLGHYRKYHHTDFHGPTAIDLRCRGVLIGPPAVARTPFVTRFDKPLTIAMTGWALLKGANFRYGVDHCLPFSDHADFPQLLELVDRVQPSHVYTHHGYTAEFADHLQSLGINARPAIPSNQLSLFD
jgi:Cft2 family RNA processing exonuclease